MARPKGSKNKPRGAIPEVKPKTPRKLKTVKPKVTFEGKKLGYRVVYSVGNYSYPYEVTVNGVNTETEAEAYFRKYFPSGEVVEIVENVGS
jgi:hypothetical protein